MNDARIITLLELFADGLNDKNCHALVFHKSALHPDPDDPDDEEATFEDFFTIYPRALFCSVLYRKQWESLFALAHFTAKYYR